MAPPRTIPPGARAGGPASFRPAPKPYRAPLVPVVPTPAPGVVDWHSFLDSFGMQRHVKARIERIFSNYAQDPKTAARIAVGYVRGTPWYAQTYPGISEAIARGVVKDEAGYRSYLNTANQLYAQSLGRT